MRGDVAINLARGSERLKVDPFGPRDCGRFNLAYNHRREVAMDSEILRSNERVKAWSNLLMNLGGALLAACAVRFFNERQLDLTLLTWTVGMAALIFAAHKVIDLLESEA